MTVTVASELSGIWLALSGANAAVGVAAGALAEPGAEAETGAEDDDADGVESVLPPQADRPMQGAIAQATKVSFESRIFNMSCLFY